MATPAAPTYNRCMRNKTHLLIICGGQSAEHGVSLVSAANIYRALDKRKYRVSVIGIDHRGHWFKLQPGDMQKFAYQSTIEHLGNKTEVLGPKSLFCSTPTGAKDPIGVPDVVFPVLHGPMGEDGTIQGLLTLAGIAYVGANVPGSVIGMDKDIQKRLLQHADIPVASYIVLNRHEPTILKSNSIVEKLGLPVFVKPVGQGSSIGITKVTNRDQLSRAVDTAFEFDDRIIIEQHIRGREIECAVLGNRFPAASIPGEIITNNDFYNYQAKYLDESATELQAPAELNNQQVVRVQQLAIQTYKALNCRGMARVDCFLAPGNRLYVNEVNTIPGFTEISMYPKLWELSGISYGDLLDRLISLAINGD